MFVCLFVDAEQEGGMKFYGKCTYCIERKFDKNWFSDDLILLDLL